MNCFKDELLRYSKLIDGALDKYLTLDSKVPKELIEGMSSALKQEASGCGLLLRSMRAGLWEGIRSRPCLMPVP